MKAIKQNDVNEFVSLLDGLIETQVNNIVGATPFLETTNALIEFILPNSFHDLSYDCFVIFSCLYM
jgi:hypothetical protein